MVIHYKLYSCTVAVHTYDRFMFIQLTSRNYNKAPGEPYIVSRSTSNYTPVAVHMFIQYRGRIELNNSTAQQA